ncbi:MAG: homocysteine S-methyltransferase family protein [Lachnospiraceae bacterium]|nr:homocysteine S-methyltransferase family protein [Lachnospiraceae bacterium]
MGIFDVFGKRMMFLDGAMGTLMQNMGLLPGELPETWNITRPEDIVDIHKSYFEAGCDAVLTNTFGANSLKFNGDIKVSDIIFEAVKNARKAASFFPGERFVALDMGPTGKLLKPLGELSFEDAYDIYKEQVLAGEAAGVDFIFIETMGDTYELKAAVLAAKENSKLPVFASASFDEKSKLLTGGSVKAVVALLEGLRVDAIGINCGLGPKQMKKIVPEIMKYSSLPVVVKPNADIPKIKNGKTVYELKPDEYASDMEEIAGMGIWAAGGCCGTTPAHVKKMIKLLRKMPLKPLEYKNTTIVSSYSREVIIGKDPILIGERINPTGKSRFKTALKENDMDYILSEGLKQQEAGAHVLDVNVGLPEIDEPEMLVNVIKELQSVCDLPLQIDTSDVKAMERAMRIYNGKPMINSVNGKQESMDEVFPLVKKYGGVVVALTLDESGIPDSAAGRFAIAEKIVNEAAKYGIDKKDIIIDSLAMTISTESKGARVTLKTLKFVDERLGMNTVLGVSNISFGLPAREFINSAFFTMALSNGLKAAIINPLSEEMMRSYYCYRALNGIDVKCTDYIKAYSGGIYSPPVQTGYNKDMTLKAAIEKGLKERARELSKEALKEREPMEIISGSVIPALDSVGVSFESKKLFLPQLLMSAEAAKEAFEVIKAHMRSKNGDTEVHEKIVLATVKGDIHDIGKNIVKVLLENYGFNVIDLGRDVSSEVIVKTVLENNIKLVGLSALMTTTVANMEITIKELKKAAPECKVMVGGAVLNKEYAKMIKADYYGKDAMSSVNYAKAVLN